MSKGDVAAYEPHSAPAMPAARPPLAGGMGSAGSAMASMRRPTSYGLLFILVFFALGGAWAALAPLTSAIIAPGVVSPDGNRRTVQHLEGGIIQDIRVREGTVVAQGDVLLVLANISPLARADSSRGRLQALLATEARLTAERLNAPAIAFDHAELSDVNDPAVAKVIQLETNQFEARRTNMENRIGVLQQRKGQLEQQIDGLKIQFAATLKQSDLIDLEIADVQQLLNQGLERRPRLLALQRAKADLQGTAGNLTARIAEAQEALGEADLQVLSMRSDRAEEVEAELSAIGAERAQIEQLLKQDQDQLARTEITAPISGTVLDLRFQTIGGVILPGEPVVDIVPADEELLIDARVSPADIDQVSPDLTAQVIFPSFPQRNMPRLTGTVRTVGADALEDPRDGQRYYSVRIGIDKDQFSGLDAEIVLKPGMPAEGYIATGERTFLTYLIRPFIDTVRRSFRES